MKLTKKMKEKRKNKILKGKKIPKKPKSVYEFPDDPHCKTKSHKIQKITVQDDGSATIEGIVIDGREHDRFPSFYGVSIFSDKESAENEWKSFKKNELKQIDPDRTKHVHEKKGRWQKIQNEIDKGNIEVI